MTKGKIYVEMSRIIAMKLNGSLDQKDEKKLKEWLDESEENRGIYHEILKEEWYKTNLMECHEYETDEGWNKVKSRVQSKPKLIQLIHHLWKYAAAVIIVFGLGYFLKDYLFSSSDEYNAKPVIVNSNSIVPGTDKATLTLEDGSVVVLGKGESFVTKNASSNGEEIVYKNNDKETVELVYNYLMVPRGGQFFIELSDGTKVWLNSESKLKYPIKFIEGKTREVELVYGEAYFDVSPSSDHEGVNFSVISEGQNIEVLGTEFNIKTYKEDQETFTTLVEGKVELNALGNKIALKPNYQTVVNHNNETVETYGINIYNETSWKDGIFSFRNKPLKEIMKVFSRWYDIEVVFENQDLEAKTFKGVLSKNQNLEAILSILKSANSIKTYEIKNNIIVLK